MVSQISHFHATSAKFVFNALCVRVFFFPFSCISCYTRFLFIFMLWRLEIWFMLCKSGLISKRMKIDEEKKSKWNSNRIAMDTKIPLNWGLCEWWRMLYIWGLSRNNIGASQIIEISKISKSFEFLSLPPTVLRHVWSRELHTERSLKKISSHTIYISEFDICHCWCVTHIIEYLRVFSWNWTNFPAVKRWIPVNPFNGTRQNTITTVALEIHF